jgi:tetratricopeptide (TPR) repeat protein
MILNQSPELAEGRYPVRLGAGPDRLDSWKEIASYLRREVRTVQLWEKKEGLPVHRHYHNHLGTVFAFRSEIEQWGLRQSEKRAAGATADSARVETATLHIEVHAGDLAGAGQDRALDDELLRETRAALERLEYPKVSTSGSPGQDGAEGSGEHAYGLKVRIRSEQAGMVVESSLYSRSSESCLWMRTFRFCGQARADTAAVVAGQIVQCLWLKVLSLVRASAGGKEVPSSRNAYLKGRYFLGRRTEESLRKAVVWFRSAMQEDPSFALPYSGLADALTLLCFYEMETPVKAMPEARQAAVRATELDPNLAEAHASLADIHLHFDRDWDAAEREYRRAIQCNPAYTLAYHWYANLLAARGQHGAAQLAMSYALELEPASLITQVWAGVTAYLGRRYEEAHSHFQSAMELDPQFIWTHMYLAQVLVQQGRTDAAVREYERTIQLTRGSSCARAMLAHASAAAGDANAARRQLKTVLAASRGCVPAYDIAAAYVALGEEKRAVYWLRRACSARSMKLFMLAQDPRFDPLRSRPAFEKMMRDLGLGGHAEVFARAAEPELALSELSA